MTQLSEKRLRIVGWALGLIHACAFCTGFAAGRRFQREPSPIRVIWEPVHAWWIYSTVRRRPWSVLFALLWLIWFALLGFLHLVAPALEIRMVG
jgi:hypothetical protein